MKKILFYTFFLLTLIATTATSQTFPAFLQGTWKLDNEETFEHWDLVNDNVLKGFSYQIKKGKIVVSEYLDLEKKGDEIIYTATVLNQNQGTGIGFKLVTADSIFSFENPSHDFPKFIRYQPFSENKMKVTVGTFERNFTLFFEKMK